MSDNHIQQKKFFDQILNNAFQNIIKSIKFIKNDPKLSVMLLYAAIELVFKARLVMENWFLILDDINNADYKKFKEGDFISIYLKSSAERIRNLFNDIDNGYENKFEKLRILRNQLTHFDIYDKKSISTVENAVISAWYPLFYLLNEKWKDSFIHYSEKFDYETKLNELEEIFHNVKIISKFYKPKKEALLDDSIIRKRNNGNYGKSLYELKHNYGHNEFCINCNENKTTHGSNPINFLYEKEMNLLHTYYCEVCEKSFIGFIDSNKLEEELYNIIQEDIKLKNIRQRLPKLYDLVKYWSRELGKRKQIKMGYFSFELDDFSYINIENSDNMVVIGDQVKLSSYVTLNFYLNNKDKNNYQDEISLCFYCYDFDLIFSTDKNNTDVQIKITERDFDGC